MRTLLIYPCSSETATQCVDEGDTANDFRGSVCNMQREEKKNNSANDNIIILYTLALVYIILRYRHLLGVESFFFFFFFFFFFTLICFNAHDFSRSGHESGGGGGGGGESLSRYARLNAGTKQQYCIGYARIYIMHVLRVPRTLRYTGCPGIVHGR